MGAAVPVAEPRWSGAHQGLALFLGRLLAPLGDRPLAIPVDPRRPDGMLGGTLPPTGLQVGHEAHGTQFDLLQLPCQPPHWLMCCSSAVRAHLLHSSRCNTSAPQSTDALIRSTS